MQNIQKNKEQFNTDYAIEVYNDREWQSYLDNLEKLETLRQIDLIRKEEDDHGWEEY